MESKDFSIPATTRQIAHGAVWMMGLKLLERSIGLVSTVILARLLLPEDFGLVAMAIAVVALLELMTAFGFDTALIQRQQTGREHYDTAWTFNVFFGLAISALVVVLAVPAATFYHEARLEQILPILALSALVGGFENIGTVAFRKELDFRSEFRFLLAKRLSTFVVTVGLAIAFRSYWALIAGTVTGRFVSVFISYRLHAYRPRISLAARADLFHFSKWLLISSLIQFLNNRSTDFILGRTVGSHGLGIYNVAFEIATLPSTELIAPLNRAVFPAYSRLSTDLDQLRSRFMTVFSMICMAAFPVSVGVLCVAEPAVKLLLGSQWLDAIPLIRIVAISGLIGALQSNLYLVILALGKPKANTYLSATVLAVSLPSIVISSLYFGATGAAFAHCLSSIVGLIGISVVFFRLTGVSVGAFGGLMIRPIVASATMAMVVWGVGSWLATNGAVRSSLVDLLVLTSTGAVTYVATIILTWVAAGRPNGPELRLLGLLSIQLQNRGLWQSR
ncbi:MAG: lipopolysaccharide biosynthesis protein [Betaproteobacteria bacterium]